MNKTNTDEYFMKEALRQAKLAYEANEVPVGAVVVANGQIIARGYNQVEQLQDATAHAEMIALTAASHHYNSKYLADCNLYVTLEPCPMCASALQWVQIKRVIYAASDPKKGYSTIDACLLHPKTITTSGILAKKSKILLQTFFQKLRN